MSKSFDELSDDDLITLWNKGDKDAMSTLISRYYGYISVICWRKAIPQADIDDVIQEVWFKVLSVIHNCDYRSMGLFKGFLITIIKNAIVDFKRKSLRKIRVQKEVGTEDSLSEAPSETFLQAEQTDIEDELMPAPSERSELKEFYDKVEVLLTPEELAFFKVHWQVVPIPISANSVLERITDEQKMAKTCEDLGYTYAVGRRIEMQIKKKLGNDSFFISFNQDPLPPSKELNLGNWNLDPPPPPNPDSKEKEQG